ncbi:MAG: TetR/AcrR family transcriptional regulator [Mycolicibacterium sp.]|uniref:TetR/AcrR family transcriptional regulator n=1 Tax=Mycolicibacterium sp. TaxID=2320850 RepID=UPI000FA86E5E|nr:TetR/AcrR family transcriptional regulator [Mycolicibacterium sp.]RUP31516.1 MAG: TetR/AcrR family transcriptional regulator [Mycolicibacterium sp.]
MPNREAAAAPEPVSRRRDDALLSAIRDATWAELTDNGYAGVTFEGVARRAKTGKPVLYRRYRSRAQMVTDALPTLRTPPFDVTSSKNLRDDILTMIKALVHQWQEIGLDTYRNLIAEADEATLETFQTKVAAQTDHTIRRALDAARDRGEIGPARIPGRVETSILALMRNEMLFVHNTIEASALAEMVDLIYLPVVEAASRKPS